jgi:cell division protein FtsQ
MSAVKTIAGVGLLVLMGWSFGAQMLSAKVTQSMPIRYVRTEGVFQYLSKAELQKTLLPLVTASIFDADVQKIQATVMQMPWVKAAEVERVWPDTIDIKVQERKAYVRWGDNSLLTENGELFTPSGVDQFKSLVLVNGPKSQEAKTLEIMKGVNTALADQSLSLAEFSINDREAWRILLRNGLEVQLGRTGQLQKLQRFLDTLTVLGADKLTAMQRVDLRYPNGFAVFWKPDADLSGWLQPKPKEEQ